jgi:hypothetical protein
MVTDFLTAHARTQRVVTVHLRIVKACNGFVTDCDGNNSYCDGLPRHA